MSTQGILVAILCVVVFVSGYFIGKSSSSEQSTTVSNGVPKEVSSESSSSTGEVIGQETETQTISAAQLTDGQKKLLTALGIDTTEIVVTDEMVACAEAKLGAARMDEIIQGATPSFTEGAKLVACYQ